MIRLLVNGQMFRENYAGVQLAVSDAKFLKCYLRLAYHFNRRFVFPRMSPLMKSGPRRL